MAGISKKRIKTKSGEKVKYTITYYDVFGKQHTSGYYDTIKDCAHSTIHKFICAQFLEIFTSKFSLMVKCEAPNFEMAVRFRQLACYYAAIL